MFTENVLVCPGVAADIEKQVFDSLQLSFVMMRAIIVVFFISVVFGDDREEEMVRGKVIQVLFQARQFRKLYCDNNTRLTEEQLKHIEACKTISVFNPNDVDHARKNCRKVVFGRDSENLSLIREQFCRGPTGVRDLFGKCLKEIYEKQHPDRLRELEESPDALQQILPIIHEKLVCINDAFGIHQELDMEDANEVEGDQSEKDPILLKLMMAVQKMKVGGFARRHADKI